MKTTNYNRSKKIRIAIIAALFTLVLFATANAKELQVNEKPIKTYTLMHEIEHELSRRRRTELPVIISFRNKRMGMNPIEINSNKYPVSQRTDAKLS